MLWRIKRWKEVQGAGKNQGRCVGNGSVREWEKKSEEELQGPSKVSNSFQYFYHKIILI